MAVLAHERLLLICGFRRGARELAAECHRTRDPISLTITAPMHQASPHARDHLGLDRFTVEIPDRDDTAHLESLPAQGDRDELQTSLVKDVAHNEEFSLNELVNKAH